MNNVDFIDSLSMFESDEIDKALQFDKSCLKSCTEEGKLVAAKNHMDLIDQNRERSVNIFSNSGSLLTLCWFVNAVENLFVFREI